MSTFNNHGADHKPTALPAWQKLVRSKPGRGRQKDAERPFLKEDELFLKISENVNFIDPDIVRQVYYGMVRVVVRELREKGIVRLPGLVDAYVMLAKEKLIHVPRVEGRVLMPQRFVLKFSPVDKLRKYFHALTK